MKQFRLFIFGLAIAIGGLAYAGDSVSGVALPLTKESAAEHVQTQSGGKILSVDEKQEGTKLLFKVKVLEIVEYGLEDIKTRKSSKKKTKLEDFEALT